MYEVVLRRPAAKALRKLRGKIHRTCFPVSACRQGGYGQQVSVRPGSAYRPARSRNGTSRRTSAAHAALAADSDSGPSARSLA